MAWRSRSAGGAGCGRGDGRKSPSSGSEFERQRDRAWPSRSWPGAMSRRRRSRHPRPARCWNSSSRRCSPRRGRRTKGRTGYRRQHPRSGGCRRAAGRRCHSGTSRSWRRRSATHWANRTGYLGEPALAIRQHERARQLRSDQARPEPPRHTHQHEQPRPGVQGCRQARPGPAALRRDAGKRKAKLGPDHPDTLTSMNNLAMATRPPASSTWPCRSSRRRWRSGRPSSAPTTPTRSSA